MGKPQDRRSPVAVLISTLTVVAILGVAVTAKHGQRNDPSDLASLESDLRLQLKLAYRHNTDQYEARLEQLDQLLEAWLGSPQSVQDEQLLTDWFHKAIRRSMPGRGQTLPAMPKFSPFDRPESEIESETLAVVEKPSVVEKEHESGPWSAPSVAEKTPEKMSGKTVQENVPTGFPYSQGPAKEHIANIWKRGTPNQNASGDNLPESGVTLEQALKPDRLVADNPKPVSKTPDDHSPDNSDSRLISHISDRGSWQAPVPVNLARLARRIIGYHHGIDEVEASLRDLPRREASAAKEPLRRLRKLAEDYRFVKLYYDTLSEEERWAVDSPQSLEPLCDQFSRVLNRQTTVREGDYLGSIDADSARADGPELRKLRDDLAWIASHLEE